MDITEKNKVTHRITFRASNTVNKFSSVAMTAETSQNG